MARRKKGIPIHGWINFYKPVGMTSTQAVGKIRYALKAQKVGHGGTLDPLASGVLPIALGEATKTVNYIQDALKIYEFTVTWGEQRTTDDAEGDVIHQSDTRPAAEDIEKILPRFMGDIEQLPPQFSAIKIDGERAYDIARDGDHADIKPRQVYIQSIEVLNCHSDGAKRLEESNQFSKNQDPSTMLGMTNTTFRITCGKGTYVRSLARDMGQMLGCYGYISALKRTKVGALELKNAISLDIFEEMIDNPTQEKDLSSFVLPLQTVLDDIPVLALKDKEANLLKNGNAVSFLSKPDLARLDASGIDWKSDNITTALATYEDTAMAMIEIYGGKIQPVRVFNV
ncbi:MAG: tRNA pseudouridine(55) synthase TruB [Alphaproteobacteria bacterium]|nr:tRNA pseudouridine(55) synthase TruB [Alphaproteobacteria bacterium]